MARRSKGEGSLYQASDKSWVCQYKVEGQRRTKRFKRKSDAKAFMDALSAAIPEVPAAFAGQPQSRAATVMTLGEWMDRWLEDYARPTVKLSTYGSYELYIRAHIKPQIGGLYLNTLTTDDLQRFFNERGKSGNLKVDGGLAPKTLTNMRNMLHLALDQAVKNRLMQGNVVEGVRLPKNQRQEMRVLDREEQERLIMAARLAPEPAAFGIIFNLFTGLRLGELCGLRWENVSMERQVFQVCETRNRLPNYDASIEAATSVRTVATTKTENSRRTVYLLDDLFHDLESYKAIQDSIARQYPGYNPDGYVFCQENGPPYEPRTYQDLFKRCVRQAGIPDANFHALRHTFATRSLDKYGHALDDHKKASIGKLGELYSGTRKMPPTNTRSGAASRGWER